MFIFPHFSRTVFVNNSNNKTSTAIARFANFFQLWLNWMFKKRNFLWFLVFFFFSSKHRRPGITWWSLLGAPPWMTLFWPEELKYTLHNLHCELQQLLQIHQYKKQNKTPTLLELTHRWTNLLLFSWSFAMCLQVSIALFKFKQGPFCTNFAGFHLWVVHLILHSRWWCVGVLLYICNRFLILQN